MRKKFGRKQKGMVDVGTKSVTKRTAIASATITMSKQAFQALIHGDSPKGNVFETAKVAGVMAAKSTPHIIPLCHPLELTKVQVDFETFPRKCSVTIRAEVQCLGRTGVEMEALTACSIAALTIYDMMKWAGQDMRMTDIQLLEKHGGKSGSYVFQKS